MYHFIIAKIRDQCMKFGTMVISAPTIAKLQKTVYDTADGINIFIIILLFNYFYVQY